MREESSRGSLAARRRASAIITQAPGAQRRRGRPPPRRAGGRARVTIFCSTATCKGAVLRKNENASSCRVPQQGGAGEGEAAAVGELKHAPT